MKTFDEDGYFDATKITEADVPKLKEICGWFIERVESFSDDLIYEMSFSHPEADFRLTCKWEDYHGETQTDKYTIPRDIFFSDRSIVQWLREEKEKASVEDERKKKKRAAAAKAAWTKRKIREAEQAEERDKQEYARLKRKFEAPAEARDA